MPVVNFERLKNSIQSLAEIGRREDHGLYRMAFSDADMQARSWLQGQIDESGLDMHVDGAANIHARLNWREDIPSVMTGSHIDTVPGAGHLDGALGVLCGLECLRSIKEQNIPLQFPLESVAFSDEEGRFGGMFGSQAISGALTPDNIHQACDTDGVKLTDAMARHGLDANDALSAQRSRRSLKAFVELHIEQGPVLDHNQIKIGVVDAIAGLFKWQVRFIGEANHAGTTPMNLRKDSFQGLAELSDEIPRILEENGSPRSVATIGRVSLWPGAANVVPGTAEFLLEVRDTSSEVLEDLANAFRRCMSAIARRRGLMFEFEVLSALKPSKCDSAVVELITRVCRQCDYTHMQMHSGAAHDTQMMANIVPAAMIFVPSKGGRSHSPSEWTAWKDIETGANVLLNTLIQLANPQ